MCTITVQSEVRGAQYAVLELLPVGLNLSLDSDSAASGTASPEQPTVKSQDSEQVRNRNRQMRTRIYHSIKAQYSPQQFPLSTTYRDLLARVARGIINRSMGPIVLREKYVDIKVSQPVRRVPL